MNVSWPGLLVLGGMLVAVLLVLVLPIPRSRTKTRTHTDFDARPDMFRDDDRYWIGGIFYNNPDDPAVFVPKRYGLGWTVNMGHPQGRRLLIWLLVGIGLLVVVVPLLVAILGTLFPGSIHPSGCHPSGC